MDVGQIEQVFMNLSSNARDAMPDGGTLMIETEIMVFDEEYITTHDFVKAGKYMLVRGRHGRRDNGQNI